MRNRIILKALEEMNERGIKFTMADLARQLGVSKRMLYEHFDSKEDLIGTIFDSIFADLYQQLREISANESLDIIEKIKAMLIAYPKVFGHINDRIIDDVHRYLPTEWVKFEHYHDEKWRMIEKLLHQGIAAGLLRPVNLAILRKMFIGAMDELLDYSFLVQNEILFSETLETAADILICGLIKQK